MSNPRLLLAVFALATPGALLAVGRSAERGPDTATTNPVKRGVDLWQAGHADGAIAAWRPAAEAGDADAQFDLAQAYKLGRGVPQDMRQAEGWYRKAALQGHDQAQATLGLILFQGGDRTSAMPWLKQAAEKGEPRAQYVYGTALFNGDAVTKDWPRAYAMMTRAAATGLPQAKTSLAQMDQFMPMAQREQGTAIAANLPPPAAVAPFAAPRGYASAAPSQPPAPVPAPMAPVYAAAAAPPAAPRAHPAPPPAAPPASIQTTPLPPSRTPDTYATETAPTAPARTTAPARPAPTPVRRAASTPPPAPVRASAPAGGGWRIQLGAYGTAGAAEAQWRAVSGRAAALGRLQPYYVKAGAITRLQAGSFRSRAAASEACRSVGATCFPVGS